MTPFFKKKMFFLLLLKYSISERCISYYTSKVGDNLVQIEKITGNTAEDLYELNPNVNLQKISPGITIFIYTECSKPLPSTPIYIERPDIQDMDLLQGSLFLCFLKYKGYTTAEQAFKAYSDLFQKNLIDNDGSIPSIFPVAQFFGFSFIYRNAPRQDVKLEIGEYNIDGQSYFCIIKTEDKQVSIVFNPSISPQYRGLSAKELTNHYYCV